MELKILGRKEAMMAPVPIKKLCMANPVVLCDGGNMSPTNARNGSMLMLMEASMIHNVPTAIQSAEALGIRHKAIDASIAPMAKYGRLLPQVGCHVRSL